MNKVICDICGSSYPETAESCPICGCSRDLSAEFANEEFLLEEAAAPEPTRGKGGKAPSKKRGIFDYDEVNPMENDVEEQELDEEDPEEQEEEEESGHNTVLVVFLVILIVALLAGAGYIFVRYFMPNVFPKETVPTTVAVQTEAPVEETTEPTIPCTKLSLSSGDATLNEAGQNFLLNVLVQPEDTTDVLTYASADESIATVSEDGRITAVAEGETVVYITCGKVQLTCPVVVEFVEETEPPTEETQAPEETEAVEETEAAASATYNPDIVLKLKKSDIQLGVYLSYQLLLDCDLEQDDVEWSVEHSWICKVDEFGNITALQKGGITDVIVKYGDQEVRCKVRVI